MPGTKTVPTVAAGETGYLVTLTWIDENNKEYANSFITKAAVSDAELQTLIDDSQAGSNASLFRLETTVQWEGVRNKTNALSAVHESVADKVRLSLKAIGTKGYTHAYLPAPLEILVMPNNEVDTSQAVYTDWRDAISAIKLAAFTLLNTSFVQYSQRNDSVSP